MKFRVIDTRTNEDVTVGNRCAWVMLKCGSVVKFDGSFSRLEDYYKVVFTYTNTLSLKPLEWKEEKGFLVAYCFARKARYIINLCHFELRYDFHILGAEVLRTDVHDLMENSTKVSHCKCIAAEHREKLVLGETKLTKFCNESQIM